MAFSLPFFERLWRGGAVPAKRRRWGFVLRALLRFGAGVSTGGVTAGRLPRALAEGAGRGALAEGAGRGAGTTGGVGDRGAGPGEGEKEGSRGESGGGVPPGLEGSDCASSSPSAGRFI
jgi:hypothetical protein